MINPITVLSKLGVDTDSPIQAIQDVSKLAAKRDWVTDAHWRRAIEELIGTEKINVANLDFLKAKYTYMYLVQNIVEQFDETDEPSVNVAIKAARAKAKAMIYRIKEGDLQFLDPSRYTEAEEIDEHGIITRKIGGGRGKPIGKKGRKGRKKAEAERLYQANKDSKSRGEIIAMFIKDLDMSKAGATTYYHNCKKELG